MIAYAMLYTVAVGIPVALAAIAIAAVLRRYGRAERLVWLLALCTAFALPALALLDPFGSAEGGSAPLTQTGVIGLPEVLVVPPQPFALDLGDVLLATWLLLSGLLVVRWAVAALRLAAASRHWTPGTLDGVPVWRTDKLGPAVAGTLRPRVLVPAWLDTLPGSQRALVLLHEQEHIRARDPMLIAIARTARVLTPWNPVVWFLTARLVRAVELDCDRRVLRRNADVATYGRTLLTVSERRPGRLVAVAAFAESEAPLRSRILAMTTPSRAVSIVALLTSMVLGVVLMVGALEIPVPTVSVQVSVQPPPAPTTEPADPQPAPSAPQPERPVVERQSIAREPEAPPSAEQTIDRLRLEAEEERLRLTAERSTRVAPPAPIDDDVSARPVFTPYTVPPSILNRDQVVRAMVEAYPALLRDAGIGGTVRVYFFIDADGVVRDTRIDQSSGHPALDDAALSVASVYRFAPALNRNERVPVWVSFPITFQVR